MDPTINIRNVLPDPADSIIDAEIWSHDSQELHELADTIVNRHPRFAWFIDDAWLSRHNQTLVCKE